MSIQNKITNFALTNITEIMKIISRELYAKRIDAWLGKEQIIVLVGQRRVGKSFMMKDFIARHQNEPDTQIVYIDKEKKDFNFIRTHNELNAYIDAQLQTGKHHYILIDEVQDIEGWEHSVRSYRTDEDTDVIITGSNSTMLSGELGTLLGGRYQELPIQGLSYPEFLQFHDLQEGDEALRLYLTYGGLPGLRNIGLENEEMVNEYLSGVFHTVMLKDVVERHNIRNLPFLNNLVAFMADTVGKLHSASNIARYMKSQGTDVSTNVVLNYLSFFNEACLTYPVGRYDIHGKKLLEANEKCYFGDVGLRNFIVGGERAGDIEKVLENVVYLHLLRLGYTVKVGQLRAGEIDFVCTRRNERKYVQVAYITDSDSTREREFGSLRAIPDDYPKYVISASPLLRSSNEAGIIHLHIREFLKQGL